MEQEEKCSCGNEIDMDEGYLCQECFDWYSKTSGPFYEPEPRETYEHGSKPTFVHDKYKPRRI